MGQIKRYLIKNMDIWVLEALKKKHIDDLAALKNSHPFIPFPKRKFTKPSKYSYLIIGYWNSYKLI